jgi:hypothetical protein
MTLESSKLPQPQNERPPDRKNHNEASKDRLMILVTLVLMLLIAGGFGYRIQISIFGGIIFERISGSTK